MSEPFNATDPLDATAERLRVLVCEAALSVIKTEEYLKLSPVQQIEALVAGISTGLLSVAFACIEPAGRDEITAFIVNYIDQARTQVESIHSAEGGVQ